MMAANAKSSVAAAVKKRASTAVIKKRQQLSTKFPTSIQPSVFVQNPVHINQICNLTKFDIPNSMEPLKFEFEISLTRNPIRRQETN